ADSGVEQDSLGRRRLARIDVGHDPDVAGPGDWCLARHDREPGKKPSKLLRLPAVMGEGLVALCHAMCVFAFLDCAATIVRCVDELAGEAVAHRALGTRT